MFCTCVPELFFTKHKRVHFTTNYCLLFAGLCLYRCSGCPSQDHLCLDFELFPVAKRLKFCFKRLTKTRYALNCVLIKVHLSIAHVHIFPLKGQTSNLSVITAVCESFSHALVVSPEMPQYHCAPSCCFFTLILLQF